MFKKIRCDHEYVTITNIYGELINHLGCRSIRKCLKCDKQIKHPELDPSCKEVNKYN